MVRMKIWSATIAVLGVLFSLVAGLSPAAASQPGLADLASVRPVMDCAALAGVDISDAVGAKVTIQSAQLYAQSRPAPYCGVRGTIAPKIGFEVRLPVNGWTQRYLQLGCGGLCGVVMVRPEHDSGCIPVTSGQTVLASTDMGHSGSMGDGAWGNDPQARIDFAYRGVHLTALASKALIARFYGRPQRYAYFFGCSDGGREALMEAQRFPTDFNGITAGAAAMNFLVQNSFYHGWQARSNTGPDGRAILTTAKLPALHRAALEACDGVDGLKDGQITDPRACHFDPATAECRPGQTVSDDCLTAAEVAVARKFYEGPRDAAGHRFTIGGPQVGSELQWAGVYVPNAPDRDFMSRGAALATIKYLAFPQNPADSYTLEDFAFDQATFARLRALHPLYDATDTDLAPFEKSGGKLLMWHGWSDPHISPINSIAYYEGVEKLLGQQRTRAFARLFLFPGLGHCGGGDGPAEFDVLTPLMAWVESGAAPDVIVAGRPVGGNIMQGPPPGPPPGGMQGPPPGAPMMGPPPGANPSDRGLADRPPPMDGPAMAPLKMERTRPVFAYPMVARYSGKGSVDDAASFVAAPPIVTTPGHYDWEGADFIAPDIRG